MVRVGKDEMGFIGHLFENWEETMIWSCLQGVMGEAWADSLPDARSAQIVTGDFCFLAGEPDGELVGNIPASFPSRSILMASRDEGWGELIEACYGDRCVKFRRYALKKETGVVEREVWESYVGRLPEEYVIRPIDGGLYRRILSEEWSHDLCSQFRDEGHFMQMGVGFVALWGEEIAGGASSYTVYREGIEIEIDVKEAHRRKGVARACAAQLILECLDRGIYPSWDAANPESLHLAETLGYHFDGSYVTYEVPICKETEERNMGKADEEQDV